MNSRLRQAFPSSAAESGPSDEHDAIEQYRRVEEWCRQEIAAGSDFLFDPELFQATLKRASQKLQFPYLSLQSFFRSVYVQHIKSASFKIRGNNQFERRYLPEYTEQRKSIKRIAYDANFSSYLMARLVVEHVANLNGSNKKKSITSAMRDPIGELGTLDCIREEYRGSENRWNEQEGGGPTPSIRSSVTRLAAEVKEAVESDPLSGPSSDRAKHFIGIEYEVALEHMVKEKGIPFTSENQLREKGSSKTPDIVLDCPIAVKVDSQWRTITWIDSKAMYGDVDTHHQYQEQCDSYIHRFGPGMILYFFGHAPISMLSDTNTANGDLVIMGWQLPDTFLWPDGTICSGISNHNTGSGSICTPITEAKDTAVSCMAHDNDAASSSLASFQLPPPSFPLNEDGERVSHIGGLEYYPNFLTKQEQEELLQLIDSQPWQSGIIARRQQFYGEVYYHTSFKSSQLQPNADEAKERNGTDETANSDDSEKSPATAQGISLQDSGMQAWLERTRPFFPTSLPSQVLINEYRNNLGIASHFEDFDAFGPVIVTISLVQPVYMTLKKPLEKTNGCDEYHDIVKILLEPGSLLVMKDEARYDYRHGIGKSKWVHYFANNDGENENTATDAAAGRQKISLHRNDEYRRVSLTIRHLLHTRRKVEGQEDEQDTIKDPSLY